MANITNAVGRRKTSIARVILKKGSGNIKINGKEFKEYLPVLHLQNALLSPLRIAEVEKAYDIDVNVSGGGVKGQAEAIQLGIARALVEISEDFRPKMKTLSLLTRDPRMVERKKFGKKKARKSFQFSKR